MKIYNRQTSYQIIWLAGLMLFFISLVLLSYAINYGLSNARGYGYMKEKLTDYIVSSSALNSTYYFEDSAVTLQNGIAKDVPEGSPYSTFRTTQVWGETVAGDLDNNNTDDYALLLTQDNGGSGTFFYVAAAFNTDHGLIGTNAVLLGDRIAPQNITITNGLILVNYADRKPGEPMTAQPSQGVSAYFKLAKASLSQVYPNNNNMITVSSPLPNTVISSPLLVQGQARGPWYFEASFPVKLYDANNNEVALTPPYIMTANDWMTTDFVPFQASLTFTPPATPTGTLVLQKDNPSGLPENDDQLIIPIKF